MTKDELQDYLIEEAEYDEEYVLQMTDYDLVDCYLKYNGLIGWTDDILRVIEAAYGIEIE